MAEADTKNSAGDGVEVGADAAAIPEHAAPGKALTPAARRALEEAAARRALAAQTHDAKASPETSEMSDTSGAARTDGQDAPHERGGPKGPEPTRFGDWEKAGRAYDF